VAKIVYEVRLTSSNRLAFLIPARSAGMAVFEGILRISAYPESVDYLYAKPTNSATNKEYPIIKETIKKFRKKKNDRNR
jgi:hypothetical protein